MQEINKKIFIFYKKVAINTGYTTKSLKTQPPQFLFNLNLIKLSSMHNPERYGCLMGLIREIWARSWTMHG